MFNRQFQTIQVALICAALGSLPGLAPAQDAQRSSYRGTAEDFAEINQLFARYSVALDTRDAEGWAALFTRDGMFRAAQFCAAGREQVAAIVKNMGGGAAVVGRPTSHHVSNVGPIVYIDRDNATVQSFLMVVGDVSRDRAGGGITVTAIYEDRLEREGGRWLFADRLVITPGDGPPKACQAEG